MKISQVVENAYQAAIQVRRRSYSPYSRFKVGAALQLKGVVVPITGCNVENASFGATICAERTALVRAVAEQGRIQPEFLVVVTGSRSATPPCGLCLQALAEFAGDQMPVYLGNERGIMRKLRFKDLFPQAFRAFKGV